MSLVISIEKHSSPVKATAETPGVAAANAKAARTTEGGSDGKEEEEGEEEEEDEGEEEEVFLFPTVPPTRLPCLPYEASP